MTLSVTSMSMSMSQNDLSRGRVETHGLLATTAWEPSAVRSDMSREHLAGHHQSLSQTWY